MLSNVLVIILMIGGISAAPRKAGINFNAASTRVSQGTVINTLTAISKKSAAEGLNTTTSRSPGSVFSSLTSMFPISLPPDSLNSTLLPPPATSRPASTSLPLSIPVSASSSSAHAVASSSKPVIPITTSTSSGPGISTTKISISVLTITETETWTFFGTISHNESHTNPTVPNSGISMPTTMQTSMKNGSSSISSASGPNFTGGPCLKDPERWCFKMNETEDGNTSSGIEQTPSNDFRVEVTVNGGDFKGGKPFTSSGTYYGNCSNGELDTEMGSTEVHKPCGSDLMCWAGLTMAALGSIVTQIMNPTPKNTMPIWCPNGFTDANSSTKGTGSGSVVSWSASETGKWNAGTSSRTTMATPGATSRTPIKLTATPDESGQPSTPLEPLPTSSLSPGLVVATVPTDAGSMVTNTALPTFVRRAVTGPSHNGKDSSSDVSGLSSVLSSDAASILATALTKSTSYRKQDVWSEWRPARPVPAIILRSIATISPDAAEFTTVLRDTTPHFWPNAVPTTT